MQIYIINYSKYVGVPAKVLHGKGALPTQFNEPLGAGLEILSPKS